MKRRNLLTLLLSLISFSTVWSTTYISDVLLIGGDWDEVCRIEKTYQAMGWQTINKDLNEKAGGDYIYLMIKTDESDGINYGYITDFFLLNGKADNLCFKDEDRVYYLAQYDGGEHFMKMKGNLNSNTGESTDNIYLYYTKSPFSDNRAISSIYFDNDKKGAVGKNGDNSVGYDLNAGAKNANIYMHTTTEKATVQPLAGSGKKDDPYLISSAAEWATFSTNVNSGLYLSSKEYAFFKLTADIPTADEVKAGRTGVECMVGNEYVPFTDVFDGGDHTINADINNVVYGTSLFSWIDGAYILNVYVTGNVISSGHHAAGLVGICAGENVLSKCRVSAHITAPNYAGGIIGHGGSKTLNLYNSYFDGTIEGFAKYAGGLMGWCDNLELNMSNCLFKGTFKPAESGLYHPIACKHYSSTVNAQLSDVYYLKADYPNIGTNSIPNAEGIEVSADYIPGVVNQIVSAADGKNYYADYYKLYGIENNILDNLVANNKGQNVTLQLSYAYNEGVPELICFPFAMKELNGGNLYQLQQFSCRESDGTKIWTATMKDATPDKDNNLSTVPGMPYLFIPNATGTVTYAGNIDCVPASKADFPLVEVNGGNGWTMRGTYSNLALNNIYGNFYSSGRATVKNQQTGEVRYSTPIFVNISSDNVLEAFSSFVSYIPSDGTGTTVPSIVIISLLDKNGNETAVGTIDMTTGKISLDSWFNLNGTPLEGKPTEPGLYLHNGSKVLIK